MRRRFNILSANQQLHPQFTTQNLCRNCGKSKVLADFKHVFLNIICALYASSPSITLSSFVSEKTRIQGILHSIHRLSILFKPHQVNLP